MEIICISLAFTNDNNTNTHHIKSYFLENLSLMSYDGRNFLISQIIPAIRYLSSLLVLQVLRVLCRLQNRKWPEECKNSGKDTLQWKKLERPNGKMGILSNVLNISKSDEHIAYIVICEKWELFYFC